MAANAPQQRILRGAPARRPRLIFTRDHDAAMLSFVRRYYEGDLMARVPWFAVARDMNQRFKNGSGDPQFHGKQCRERYLNYVDPSLDKSPFSELDLRTLLDLHRSLDGKWAVIARNFPRTTDGKRRSELLLKNVFRSLVRSRRRRDVHLDGGRPRHQAMLDVLPKHEGSEPRPPAAPMLDQSSALVKYILCSTHLRLCEDSSVQTNIRAYHQERVHDLTVEIEGLDVFH